MLSPVNLTITVEPPTLPQKKTLSKLRLKVSKKLATSSELPSGDDLTLEDSGNIKAYLSPKFPSFYEPYQKNFNDGIPVDKFSIIGPPSLLKPKEKESNKRWKRLSIVRPTRKIICFDQVETEKPEIFQQEKLQSIQSDSQAIVNKFRNKESSKKCNRILSNHSKTQRNWSKMERILSNKTKKSVKDLVITRSSEFRSKVELQSRNQQLCDDQDKVWHNIWRMTLRNSTSDKLGSYFPVGNLGIYALQLESKESMKRVNKVHSRLFESQSASDVWTRRSPRTEFQSSAGMKLSNQEPGPDCFEYNFGNSGAILSDSNRPLKMKSQGKIPQIEQQVKRKAKKLGSFLSGNIPRNSENGISTPTYNRQCYFKEEHNRISQHHRILKENTRTQYKQEVRSFCESKISAVSSKNITPGPGRYNLNISTNRGRSAVIIGKPRTCEKSFDIGPGSYNPEKNMKKLPVWSIPKSIRRQAVNNCPASPMSYTPKTVMYRSNSCPFGKAKRFKENVKPTPGPSDYASDIRFKFQQQQ